MFRSLLNLLRVDPGYDPRGVLTFLLVRDWRGSGPQRTALLREIQDWLCALPGVEKVAAAALFPLTRAFPSIGWGAEPALADPTRFQAADFQTVLPGNFETLCTPLIAGRAFREDDNAPDRKLVVIDQALAAKAFPGGSAVGKRLLLMWFGQPQSFEVIGVVAHQRCTSLAEPGREQVYLTDGFAEFGVGRYWAIRTAGDPAKFAPAVRTELERLDLMLMMSEVQPMDALVERARAGTRFPLLLIGVFAGVAALLAGVGLYGVLSTLVRQRTSEIGVRMALGAAPASIFGLVVGHGLGLSAAGIAVGFLAALGLTRVISTMLVGVQATGPSTFVAVAVLYFLIAAATWWLPARRAAALDPAVTLREE